MDPDDFEDVDPSDFEDVEPAAAAAPPDQGPPLDIAGARAALEALARGNNPALAEHQQALMQVLNARRGPRKLSALEAANVLGSNMAGMGIPAAMDPRVQEQVDLARAQHPGVGTASEIAGGAGVGMMLPAGYASGAAQGGVTGWNMSKADNLPDRIGDALFGAGTAMAGQWVMPRAMNVVSELGDSAKTALMGAGGSGLKKLGELLGHKPPANTDAGAGGRAMDMAGQLDDAARANPMPESAAGVPPDDPYYGVAQRVNQQGEGNIRPGDWQPVPQERVDMEALQKLIQRQDLDQYYARKADMDAINAEIAANRGAEPVTKNVVRPSGGAPASAEPVTKNVAVGSGPDTDAMSMYDAMHMDDFAVAPPPPAPPKPRPNAIDALSEFARLEEARGAPAPAAPKPSPVAPLDAKRQAIIDAQKANPEALAAFGVDPKQGERGFIDLGAGLLAAKAGGWAAKKAADYAAPRVYGAGEALEGAARRAGDAARKASSDPNLLMQLMREGGRLGGAATAILQALQAGDQKGLRAQTMMLEMNPEFRSRFAPDTADQGPPESIASGF